MTYICRDGRLVYYTGEAAHPDEFPANLPRGTQAQINRIRQSLEEMITDAKIKNERLTKAVVKENLDRLYKSKMPQDSNLFDQMNLVIAKMESGRILTPRSKKKYSPGTLKGLRHTIRILQEFKPGLTQSEITLKTYEAFIHYCQEKNYSTNYIGGQIKNWKTLGKAVGGNSIYDHEDFKIISEINKDVYLDESEIKKIYELNLSPALSVTRDWFVLDCYTGLRVSDLTLLSKKNYSKGMITIANEKTDESVIIPVHPFVKEIFAKYKGFPPKIADQSLNDNIKLIAKKAGISGTVLYTITKGGIRKDEYLKKWQMISNHSARRSFITNLRKNGVPDSVVMKLTGIKSPATLKRYDQLTSEEAARIAAGHSFFKKK